MHKLRILILYPDPAGLALLTSMLKSLGHIIEEAANDRMAVRLMERENIDLVLAGVDPGDGDALELLTYVRRKHREVPVVLLFPRLHPERAKEALRLGAMAVLKYPVPAAELRAAVLQALEQCESRAGDVPSAGSAMSRAGRARRPVPHRCRSAATGPSAQAAAGKATGPAPPADGRGGGDAVLAGRAAAGDGPGGRAMAGDGPGGGGTGRARPAPGPAPAHRLDLLVRELGLIGNDPSWRQVVELAATIAASRSPVLIAGEPGTGKSQLARLIHALGTGPDRPFVAYEAASLADETAGRRPEDPSRGRAPHRRRPIPP